MCNVHFAYGRFLYHGDDIVGMDGRRPGTAGDRAGGSRMGQGGLGAGFNVVVCSGGELDKVPVLDVHPACLLSIAHFFLSLLAWAAMSLFNFSFSLSVPGITNPFTAAAEAEAAASESAPALHGMLQNQWHADWDDRQRPAALTRPLPPSPSLLPPVSKKRGWVPSSSEPSRPAPIRTSTSGYLDTPAKYREMLSESADQSEIEELVAGESSLSLRTFHVSFAARCAAI